MNISSKMVCIYRMSICYLDNSCTTDKFICFFIGCIELTYINKLLIHAFNETFDWPVTGVVSNDKTVILDSPSLSVTLIHRLTESVSQ